MVASTVTSSGRSSQSDSTMSTDSNNQIIDVAAHGDLVLRVEHETPASKAVHAFRVSSPSLKNNSKYFERLLVSGRFGEASNIEAKHTELRGLYESITEAPAAELPAINIQDIGRTSKIKAVDALLADFLYILHGKDTTTFPPVANLANLAIVADRFDALDTVKNYVKRKKMLRAIDGKTTPKIDAALTEEKVRQRLLVGVHLEYPLWIEKYSLRLITKGWVGKEVDLSAPLWYDLPSCIEDELAFRRECVLETVQSLQAHFVGLYTSRERQCKLGYDSSSQCDSFQLGEMIRFFTRIGTLKFQGTIIDANDPSEPYNGDVYSLLDMMRQVPEYQIDKFHTHCGIRTRITPLLDMIQECLQYVRVCPDCWREDRLQYSWMEANRPLLWKIQTFRPRADGCANRHAEVRAMFTATERHWS